MSTIKTEVGESEGGRETESSRKKEEGNKNKTFAYITVRMCVVHIEIVRSLSQYSLMLNNSLNLLLLTYIINYLIQYYLQHIKHKS